MTYADPFDDPTFDPEGDPADYAPTFSDEVRWFVASIFDPADIDRDAMDDAADRWLAEMDSEFASLALRALDFDDDEAFSW